MAFDPASLRQTWRQPSRPIPIVTIGAGSIVNDGHFPAYRKGGFPIAGVFDLDAERARAVGERFGVRAFGSLEEALSIDDAIFDLATPPAAHASVLERMRSGAGVVIQKPMGADLDDATRILKICRERKLKAAVNFQLRFSPMMLAVKDAVDHGLVGRLLDVEVRVSVDTPWNLFAFLKDLPRIEIAVHSIHYLDLIRSFLGDPGGVHAKDDRPPLLANGADPNGRNPRLRRRGAQRHVGQPQPRLWPETPGRGVSFRGVGWRGARQDGRAARLP
jgi:predicted dehydrogenase